MVVPRWKKVLADLWSNKTRTLLVVLSIAVGVFAVGFVANTYLILNSDVPADFLAGNPHAAIIITEPFDDELLFALAKTPGVGAVEGRSSVGGKMKAPDGKTYPITISRRPGIRDGRIDILRPVPGSPAELRDHEIFLERQVATTLGIKVGDIVPVILNDDHTRDLRVAGIVHDVNASGFYFSHQADAYTNLNTIQWLGGTDQYDSVYLTVSENGSDEAHVREVATAVSDKIKKSGRQVYVTSVYKPGHHPAQQTLDALLALMGGLGVLAVFLSAFLVFNTITALMGQQIRQIGVMRAVGASIGQVVALYLVLVLAFGITSLVLAIPASGAAAYGMVTWMAGLLNIDLTGFRIPTTSLVLEIAVGLGLPVFGALIPVFSGTRITVREALSNYGVAMPKKTGWFDRLLENIRGLPRPLLLSIRNTFRRKGRLFLTLATLTLGGAIFIGVFGVRDSMYLIIQKTFGYFLSDVNVSFSTPYRTERIQEAIKGIPGIVSWESWGFASAQALKADGKTSDQVIMIAPPSTSKLIQPVLTSGRWLTADDENAIVVGNSFVKLRPETRVGDVVQMRMGNKNYPFKIVGIFEMAGGADVIITYTNLEYLARITNQVGRAYELRFKTVHSDPASQLEVQKALEARFKELGMSATLQNSSDLIQQQNSVINILIGLLLAMAVLIAVVGGLGLMGTMSMNVLERTREIGVMRSVGAENLAVFQLVIVEGMFIGLISWGLGALLSIPITNLLDTLVGVSMLNVPLEPVFSFQGLIIWLVLVLILSTLASLMPARNAVRLTLRDVLAYE
ncbi:MAG TPA: FtsX-like permease family protein [Anaerolineaceae bacterium]|nr:FtsX-like permease family protein [Anaerolineaceae bacterium]